MDGGKSFNPRIALILAIVPGLFGFLGLGLMYKRSWGWGIGTLILGLLFVLTGRFASFKH